MVEVALAWRLVVMAASRPRVLRAVLLSDGFWYDPLMNEYSMSRAMPVSSCATCQSSSLVIGFIWSLLVPDLRPTAASLE